jgi:hypothetical protein
MNILRLSPCVSLAVALLTPWALRAEDAAAPLPPLLNTVCPMTGKPIDTTTCETILVTFGEGINAKQYRLAISSKEGCVEFMKDPTKPFKPGGHFSNNP